LVCNFIVLKGFKIEKDRVVAAFLAVPIDLVESDIVVAYPLNSSY
jgi:hypothetical protein